MKIKVTILIVTLLLIFPLLASCSGKFASGIEGTSGGVGTAAPEPKDTTADIDGPTYDTTGPATETEYHRIGKSEDGRLTLWGDELSPVKVVYEFMGYACEIYETEDRELIDRLVAALKNVEVGEDGAESGSDNSDVIFFMMDDGSEYSVTFNFGNLEEYTPGYEDGVYYRVYETSGFGEVKSILYELKEAVTGD